MPFYDDKPSTLTYHMGELGDEVNHFSSRAEAMAFMKNNPPGSTVRCVFFQEEGGLKHGLLRASPFSYDDYNKAVEEKRWRETYFKRTGKKWTDADNKPDPAQKVSSDKEQMDDKTCLSLFGLKTPFTLAELKKTYRQLIKNYHPDKVAALADEFKILAEKRTKQINLAYSKLASMVGKN